MHTLASGLGKEASKHLVRLNAHKFLLAVRSIKKGEAAKAEAKINRMGVVQVYELDYSSYDAVKALAARLAELESVDVPS